jgi:hypothetical protein
MPLTDDFNPDATCSGVVARFGELHEVVDRIEEFLRKTLPHLLTVISPVRKNSSKPRNEKDLCAELGKRLNFAASGELFRFYPEDPENESCTRTLDYGVQPQLQFVVGSRVVGAMDRLYAIEAKRLPTHTSPIDQPEREREYVVGDWKLRSSSSKRISGGIERFKEGLHGAALERVGMIAFLQKNDSKHWLGEVNRWITDLIHSPSLKSHQARWTSSDILGEVGAETAGVTELVSIHERTILPPIHIAHFWLIF